MKYISLILILISTSISIAVQFNLSNDIQHFIDIGNLLINLNNYDSQIGFVYKNDRTTYSKIGFLKFKNADASLAVGGTFGRSWTAIMKVETNLYGITPGQYSFDFVISPEKTYASWKINQKFFFANNVLSFSTYERIGDLSAGFSRVYMRFQNREIGAYRLNEGLFAGFFPYTVGQTGEEGFFMGAGWMNGFSGFFSFRSRWALQNTSAFIDPFVIIKTNSVSFGIRMEVTGSDFRGDLLFTGRQVLFSVSF
ncbi:MAG TPA: hypothetical protein VIL29_12370 [Pseudothermotoga sp.]